MQLVPPPAYRRSDVTRSSRFSRRDKLTPPDQKTKKTRAAKSRMMNLVEHIAHIVGDTIKILTSTTTRSETRKLHSRICRKLTQGLVFTYFDFDLLINNRK